jgi:hypothetical protein
MMPILLILATILVTVSEVPPSVGILLISFAVLAISLGERP